LLRPTLDYFVGRLRCSNCDRISEPDLSTNMATRIRSQPELAYLGVGDALEIEPDSMRDAGYVTVRRPAPGEAVHILEVWECPYCGQAFNWAEIVVRDGVIAEVTAVPLNLDNLKRAHFITDEAVGLIDRPYREAIHLPDSEFVQLLMQAVGEAKP
jgi:hypothetical protein